MSVSQLPSGRWRAQVHDPATGRNTSVSRIIGGTGTFATKREAKAAREAARAALQGGFTVAPTVSQWRTRWLTDPLFRRPKESTMIHNASQTRRFAEAHHDLPLNLVDDQIVAAWIAEGRNASHVPALRAMFNDAASAKAGRLIDRNPFAGLGLKKSPGNRDSQPPSEQTVQALIQAARDLCSESLAAWLQVAAYTGMRPGELDALRWANVDFQRGRIHVTEQYSAASGTVTLPKNGRTRWAPLTPPAREALFALPRQGEWCFPSLNGRHWTASARAYHWKAIRTAAGWDGTLYLATRHFAGAYMTNTLRLASEDVAIALGHTDGGQLVRTLYGHRDRDQALDRVQQAFENRSNVVPLRRDTTA